ncbi:hypothetical protein DL764_009606 [Monosporascus ibericus]|uniref:Uncharacterized protein n=1 Tax=Monosporascus ibericus TaxID=155417 RepID=A0A4Q4SXL3_9PEZI|nr:hypothetical protein DL764_009606 [Monosporascus ibericus]
MLLMNALRQSFAEEFKAHADDIQRQGDEVREELALAKAQADHQDRELQEKERELASGHRRKLSSFISGTKVDIETIKESQLQRDLRHSRQQRQLLLDKLSSYDHLSPFREARKKRHCSTAEWIFSTSEFNRWNDATASSLLWCCGKIGSGKTILTFLWVTYLIDELCTQCCDDDIRKSLRNLPKDLEETFNRALSRIVSRGRARIVQRIFPWVAAAKENLTLNELREAISTDIGQPYSKPEKLVNGIERIVAWCENLLQVDEERQTVQFAHGTIYDFITGKCSKPQLANFHVDLEGADHHAGEICITYLHLNDFKTTLARRPQPIRPPVPTEIAQTALGRRGRIAQSTLRFMGFDSNHCSSNVKVDVIGTLASYKRADANQTLGKFQLGHPLLSRTALQAASGGGHWEVVDRLLAAGANINAGPANYKGRTALQAASEGGHVEVVEQLLAAGANINAEPAYCEGRTALQAASGNGHLEVVKRLLAARANINAEPAENFGRTALQAASERGYLGAVKLLLAAKANINAAPGNWSGRTALQAASGGGHLEVVERLLAAGANINTGPADYEGPTALQAALEGGRLDVVERLKRAGAE